MNIHEYQAKQVLKGYGAPVAAGVAITSADQAEAAAKQLPGPLYVVKSQIHAGGRGKGKFKELPADAKGGVRLAFFIFLLPTGLNLAWLGPITAAVQHLVPAAMRSTASALFLLINNLLGIAVGFYYFGWMSDLLAPRFGDESLRWAIYTGMGFYVLAAILLVGASRTLKRDWVD